MENVPTPPLVSAPQGNPPAPEVMPPVAPVSTETPEPPSIAPPPPPVPAITLKEPWFSGNRAIGFILSVVLLVAAGTAAFLFYSRKTPKPPDQFTVAPTPTPQATPTPLRTLSSIATQSAFLSVESETASLSGDLQLYQIQDPSLSPPVMDLPLGFSN